MYENPVNKRLRMFIEYLGLTVKLFGEEIDTPDGTLKNMFSRGTNPSSEMIIRILSRYPDFSANWMLTGSGEMLFELAKIGNDLNEKMQGLKKEAPAEKPQPEKETSSILEMLKMISDLSAENALLKQKAAKLEEQLSGYSMAAETKTPYAKKIHK